MNDRMTIFGVGPQLALLTFVYSLFPILLTYCFPQYSVISFLPVSVFNTIGVVLLAIGIPLWAVSVRTILGGFKEGVLCTEGVYSIVRHPLYSALIVFIVPGILMFFRSWVLFTSPFAGYMIFKRLIHEEEECLEEQFGKDYLRCRHTM